MVDIPFKRTIRFSSSFMTLCAQHSQGLEDLRLLSSTYNLSDTRVMRLNRHILGVIVLSFKPIFAPGKKAYILSENITLPQSGKMYSPVMNCSFFKVGYGLDLQLWLALLTNLYSTHLPYYMLKSMICVNMDLMFKRWISGNWSLSSIPVHCCIEFVQIHHCVDANQMW